MLALIDADTPAFAGAVMAEGQDEQVAKWNTNAAIEKILAQWNIKDFQLFITGENNFRYKIYPEYKANRINTPRPTYLEVCKQHLVDEWGGLLSDGCEADDLLGIEQTKYSEQGVESVIVSIDKDLDMIPGWHISPEIVHKGIVVKPGRKYLVSPQDALYFFYYQLLVGDTTDGIKGVKGIGPKKAKVILNQVIEDQTWEGSASCLPEAFYQTVLEYYSCEEELDMNAQVLYIHRIPNDNWKRIMKDG